jgi:hypothetical protein
VKKFHYGSHKGVVAGRFFVSPKPLSLGFGLLLVWSWAKKNLQFPTGTINKVIRNGIII